MQNLLNSNPNDEINLRELFITLWAHKLLISFTVVLSIIYSGYYALNKNKEYTSTAIFKLGDDPSSNSIYNQNLGPIAALAGIRTQYANNNIKDLISGRVFIEKLDARLNFQADTYFNNYNPSTVDPIWKSIIKRVIGWHKSPANAQEIVWQGIVKTYLNNLKIEKTEDGAIKIVIKHATPQRAAQIANVIMDEIISGIENKRNTEQDQHLNYLSNTLAKALIDLEASRTNLKEFTLENSVLTLKSFEAKTIELDALREQLNRTSELHEAVAALSLMIQNKTTDQSDYLALRDNFPIIDQVEFRRVLGQNEIISSWNWPKLSSVNTVFNTLSERKSILESKINTSQLNAERLGQVVEAYTTLERNAKTSEATYTVLIEQVKAQSMISGYRPDKSEIYEYATAPINPSSPKRNLILAFGGSIGLILGVALSLLFALYRGVYYSKTSLKSGAQARLTTSVRGLLPLRNKNLNDLISILAKKPNAVLRELAVEINKNAITQVVVTSSLAKMTSNDVARALCSYMQSDTMKVAVIDFSSKPKKQNTDDEKLSIGSFNITERAGHLSALKPVGSLEAIEMLSQRDFWENIQSLNSTFDLVFLCADDRNALSLLSALEGKKMLHITLARSKKTKSNTLAQMRSLLPIQGLIHE